MIQMENDITITENMLQNIIYEIGDNPHREGLEKTPKRIIRSWNELYNGYKVADEQIEKMMTCFTNEEKYDEIILLKDIEFYSMCEHHMLPFFGKAHIAYIPDDRIVGISKLARLLEIYSRRLQIQERIGKQVVDTLDKFLKPKGSACILEAQHFCMIARGINKQNSIMVTSSLSGRFMESMQTKNELMYLIKRDIK